MNSANLIKMANQIGTFFAAMPDRQQAILDVANHIQKNWEPRMRAELIAHVATNGVGELNDIVRDALQRIDS